MIHFIIFGLNKKKQTNKQSNAVVNKLTLTKKMFTAIRADF